jgi:hypothetical protein
MWAEWSWGEGVCPLRVMFFRPQSQRDLAIRQGQAYYLSKEKIHIVPVYLKTFRDKVVTPLTKYLIQKPKYEIIKHSQ